MPLRVAEMIHDYPEDDGADEVLGNVGVAAEDGEDALVCAFPDHRVNGDNGGGEQQGTPVWRQVDDARRQAVVEQHVAGEVSVDQLVTALDRP